MSHWRRLGLALGALLFIVVGGSVGYVILGFGALDAVYQTVTTVATVGFREVEPLSDNGKVFTMVLILAGVGTTLYTLSVIIETFIEGQLSALVGRRRMERRIADLRGHVIVCGWGRVGRALAPYLTRAGGEVVVVDQDADRLADVPYTYVIGDATDDATLTKAGIERARALVAALDTDAANLFVTLSARARRPDLFIVARARVDTNETKLVRAGADRVVNPQSIGGARMAAFVLQPNVAEFLDVVMHDGSLEFRLSEVTVQPGSPLADHTLRDGHIRDKTGALVLAIRPGDGSFATNPDPDSVVGAGHVLIAIGTSEQLACLAELAGTAGHPPAGVTTGTQE